MNDIILNEESSVQGVDKSFAITVCEMSELEKAEPNEPCEAEQNEPLTKEAGKKKKKQPRALVIASIVFTSLSLVCAIFGLIPFQLFFVLLGLVFYIIDRIKNGKRGISLFGMICTLATFVVITVTLIYCIILLGIGIYTVYINPEPYNFVTGTFKGFISWILGLFGINFNF